MSISLYDSMQFEEKLKNIIGHNVNELSVAQALYPDVIICAASIHSRRNLKVWLCNVYVVDSNGNIDRHMYFLMETNNELGIGFCDMEAFNEKYEL